MKIALGADHGGFELKEKIKEYLKSRSLPFEDFGTHSGEAIDYPVIALKVANAVASKQCERGLLFCGTGIGISIAANKVKGIRAACCSDAFSAKYTRLHNDANILCLGGRVLEAEKAIELIDLFLNTAFEGGRHQNRLDQITMIEEKAFIDN